MYWTLDYSKMDEIVSAGMCRIDATIEAACAELDKLKIKPEPTAADIGIDAGGTLSGLMSQRSVFCNCYGSQSRNALYAQQAMASNMSMQSGGRLLGRLLYGQANRIF